MSEIWRTLYIPRSYHTKLFKKTNNFDFPLLILCFIGLHLRNVHRIMVFYKSIRLSESRDHDQAVFTSSYSNNSLFILNA